jgi:threonine dehydratase
VDNKFPRLLDAYLARNRIAPFVRRTPLVESAWLSKHSNGNVYIKPENQQKTGSFKLRGAANKILSLTSEERERGVITVSSGNHGRAVAYMARELGITAVVCMSSAVPDNKVQAVEELGAELAIIGDTYDETNEHAIRLQVERQLTFVHPFDDREIIAGQATIGLEIIEDLPEIDTVIVPLSGGGLLGGIALALKSIKPDVRTIGVSMDRGPAMYESIKAGKITPVVEEPTLADALAGGLGEENKYTYELIRDYVDQIELVSEEEIAAGMRYALETEHLVVEGGGAVGLALLLGDRVSCEGQRVAVVASGGNTNLDVLIQVAQAKIK